MKKQYILMLLFFVAQVSLAQTFFEYDQAGNRIRRTFTPFPDLTPNLQISPTTTYGSAPITAKLYVSELNGAPTSGSITVKITKESHITFSFNPTATSVGGTTVQNANWSFDASSDANYYVLTSSTSIAGSGLSTIGLSGTLTAGSSPGQLSISMVITGGSGGEIKINNNSVAIKLNYFP